MYPMDLPSFNNKISRWHHQVVRLHQIHNRCSWIPQWFNYSTRIISKMSINSSWMSTRSTITRKETCIPGVLVRWASWDTAARSSRRCRRIEKDIRSSRTHLRSSSWETKEFTKLLEATVTQLRSTWRAMSIHGEPALAASLGFSRWRTCRLMSRVIRISLHQDL